MNKKILIIDIGNTSTDFAVFKDENLEDFLGFFKLPEEIEKAKESLKFYRDREENIDDGMIFSVVPNNDELVQLLVKEVFDKEISVFNWREYKLVKNSPLIKEAIGADLLADLRQADVEYGGPCLIADFGTVTKLLQTDKDGNFVGLSFIPGIEISLKLFSQNTALLPKFEHFEVQKGRLGLNTFESMSHGIYYSTVYYVKDVYKSLNDKNVKLIITGGNHRYIKNEFSDAIIDPELTLKGMYVLYKETQK
jgi:type III pantothenate kinase